MIDKYTHSNELLNKVSLFIYFINLVNSTKSVFFFNLVSLWL
jgi:hypothetical protein